jgi:hypothetical protein
MSSLTESVANRFLKAATAFKLEKIPGTSVKGLGYKYQTTDGLWRVIPVKGSVRHPGVGQKRQSFVEWQIIEMKGDRTFTVTSMDAVLSKLASLYLPLPLERLKDENDVAYP